jgi:uncharacterized protein YbjT (DUF2867 family)
MSEQEINVITGAFSYTGKYITRRLLAMNKQVRTLTGHPQRPNPFGSQVSVYPLDFARPLELARCLEGATTLYNTYWIRFAHGTTTFEKAVENTILLIRAAEKAGVRRSVHVSITNPALDSRLPYFRGKALLEKVIQDSRLEYAIVRPTVIFGDEDILINNIAWLLRRFPAFPIFGSGAYKLQPIYVEDIADLVVQAGQKRENLLLDAVGPDTLSFEELVRLLARVLDRHVMISHVPPRVGFALAKLLEPFVGDVLITRDEIAGLMAGLLVSRQAPTGSTRLEDWLREHKQSVGSVYASELQRHYR